MRMPLEELTSRIRAVAVEYSGSVNVAGVLASDGESDHVELLLTLTGCHQEPCTVMVTLPRDHEAFEAALREQVREALAAHGPGRQHQ